MAASPLAAVTPYGGEAINGNDGTALAGQGSGGIVCGDVIVGKTIFGKAIVGGNGAALAG
jgi:hypothetical protein